MNILAELKSFYDKIGCDPWKYMSMYIQNGYFFSSPNHILFGKPVRKDEGDHINQWNPIGADAWYVRCAIGESGVSQFIEQIPYPLPYVGWQRQLKNKKVKFYELTKILRMKI